MAGKRYFLPRPGLDPVAQGAGADNVGYPDGFKPPARYARSNATETWRNATDSVTNQLHCNIRPRVSLAGTLSKDARRRAQAMPYVPGRLPAPRVEIGCGHPVDELDAVSGSLARDLSFRKPQSSPTNPDGGPPAGPGPNPPGINPLPPPLPGPPTATPPAPTPTTPETENPPLSTPPTWMYPPISERVPGTLQAINFHFTGDISGGAAASELRVHGPVGVPFIIRQIWLNADSGVTPGQFLDVIVSDDGEVTDTANPTGQSIFPLLNGVGSLPTPDGERGLAIPAVQQDLRLAFRVDKTNAWLKLRSYFVAPALGLPNIHVTMVIERMDAPGMNPPPMVPRPPIDSPTAPPVIPQPTPPIDQPPVKSPPLIAPTAFVRTAPAWKLAAQGLQVQYRGTTWNYDPSISPYASWLVDRTAPNAQDFRDRIDRVLTAAGIENGTPDTLVDVRYAVKADRGT